MDVKPVKDLPEALSSRLGGKRYLWCRECHRTFQEDDVIVDDQTFERAVQYAAGSPNLDRLAEAVFLRARCPYENCRVPLQTVDWGVLRGRHPEFPDAPESGVEYRDLGEDPDPEPVELV